MKRNGLRLSRVLSATLLAWLVSQPLLAIPAFARRYELPCHYCHDGFPKLSLLGQRFKERGFRLEQEKSDSIPWLDSVPVTLRAGANRAFVENERGTTAGFFKAVSAGSLGTRFSYWLDQVWAATEDNLHRVGTDNAWVRIELMPGQLYLRGGRMEMDLPFTQARSPHLFLYETLFANTGFESDNLGSYQDGVELGGFLGQDTRWSLALVKGRNSPLAESLSTKAGRFDGNVFARAASRFGENRLGGFVYLGRNTLARTELDPSREQQATLVWNDNLLRVGGDASVWLRQLNLYAIFIHGRNDNSIADIHRPGGTEQTLSFSGGFLQADYHLLNPVAATFRFNVLSRPPGESALPNQTSYGIFPGVQVWLWHQMRLSVEFGFRNRGQPVVGAAQIEVAF